MRLKINLAKQLYAPSVSLVFAHTVDHSSPKVLFYIDHSYSVCKSKNQVLENNKKFYLDIAAKRKMPIERFLQFIDLVFVLKKPWAVIEEELSKTGYTISRKVLFAVLRDLLQFHNPELYTQLNEKKLLLSDVQINASSFNFFTFNIQKMRSVVEEVVDICANEYFTLENFDEVSKLCQLKQKRPPIPNVEPVSVEKGDKTSYIYHVCLTHSTFKYHGILIAPNIQLAKSYAIVAASTVYQCEGSDTFTCTVDKIGNTKHQTEVTNVFCVKLNNNIVIGE